MPDANDHPTDAAQPPAPGVTPAPPGAGGADVTRGEGEAIGGRENPSQRLITAGPGCTCHNLTIGAPTVTDPDRPVDPDCRDGKHGSCVGAPCGCTCHATSDADRDARSGRLLAGITADAVQAGEYDQDDCQCGTCSAIRQARGRAPFDGHRAVAHGEYDPPGDDPCGRATPHAPHRWQAAGAGHDCPGKPDGDYGVVDDGHGSTLWRCGPDCDLQAVRPGRFQRNGADDRCPDWPCDGEYDPPAEAPAVDVPHCPTYTCDTCPGCPDCAQSAAEAPAAETVALPPERDERPTVAAFRAVDLERIDWRQRAERAERDAKLANDAFEELYAVGMRTSRHGDRYRLAWQSARRRAMILAWNWDRVAGGTPSTELRHQVQATAATIAARDATITELQAEIRDLNAQCKATESELKSAEAERDRLDAELEVTHSRLGDLADLAYNPESGEPWRDEAAELRDKLRENVEARDERTERLARVRKAREELIRQFNAISLEQAREGTGDRTEGMAVAYSDAITTLDAALWAPGTDTEKGGQ